LYSGEVRYIGAVRSFPWGESCAPLGDAAYFPRGASFQAGVRWGGIVTLEDSVEEGSVIVSVSVRRVYVTLPVASCVVVACLVAEGVSLSVKDGRVSLIDSVTASLTVVDRESDVVADPVIVGVVEGVGSVGEAEILKVSEKLTVGVGSGWVIE